MPRLVSLTLLSLLAAPCGAIIYFMMIVGMYEVFGWRAHVVAFSAAGIVGNIVVAAWWLLLWRRSVRWTAWRVRATIVAAIFSILFALIVGLSFGAWVRETDLGIFLAACLSIFTWLTCVCIIWRDRAADLTTMNDTAERDVACPKCRYAMTGLREARCPECGEQYTLDQLFAAQRIDDRIA
jgi:hypothetical protein